VEVERAARARSFGSVADAYERGRPGYPEEAVRWLVGDEPRVVVDVGAGTGKLTRQLVAAGHDVVAVEPLPEMLAHVRRVAPSARALEGSAESIPLEDETADVVTAAQAFHWFDHAVALPEMARVLRPDGVLALIWNMRDESVEWMTRLGELLGVERTYHEDYQADVVIVESGLFAPAERRSFPFSQRVDRQTLRELVLSRSGVAMLPADEQAGVLAQVDRLYDEVADGDGLTVPYETHTFRAVKAGAA
jgi:SAM-dependent methyltransferase